MSNIFDSIQSIAPERSRHTIIRDFIGDVPTGAVIPIACIECVPSDNHSVSCDIDLRSFPMTERPFGQCSLDVNAFYVPCTQLDEKFSERVTGCDVDGGDSNIPYSIPLMHNPAYVKLQRSKSHGKFSLRDYMGLDPINTSLGESTTKDALNATLIPYPILAYYRIWNYFYRDPIHCIDSTGKPIMHVDSIEHSDGSNPKYVWFGNDENFRSLGYYNNADIDMVLYSTLEGDYFTKILARRQAGVPPVMSVSGFAPLNLLYDSSSSSSASPAFHDIVYIQNSLGNKVKANLNLFSPTSSGSPRFFNPQSHLNVSSRTDTFSSDSLVTSEGRSIPAQIDSSGNVTSTNFSNLGNFFPVTDFSDSIGISIEDWRVAMQLQRYLERINVCGSYYEQYLLSMFSTAPHSEVLREPVWIGGFRLPIVFSEVTCQDSSQLGKQTANAWTQGGEFIGDYFCKDYGYILVLATIRPDVSYAQGVERMWQKPNRFSWLNPLFERLGEQEVYRNELFHLATDDSSDSNTSHTSAWDSILGFNPRYAELYTGRRLITGSFRNSMSNRVFSRAFTTDPNLTKDLFIVNPAEYADKWTVTDQPQWLCESRVIFDSARPIMDNPMPL